MGKKRRSQYMIEAEIIETEGLQMQQRLEKERMKDGIV